MPKKTVQQDLREQLERCAAALDAGRQQYVSALETIRQQGGQIQSLQKALADSQAMVTQTQDRMLQMADQVIGMKREGFTAPYVNRQNLEKLDLELDDQVLDAMSQRAQEGSDLYAQLGRYALQQQRAGYPTEQVIASILNGRQEEEDART